MSSPGVPVDDSKVPTTRPTSRAALLPHRLAISTSIAVVVLVGRAIAQSPAADEPIRIGDLPVPNDGGVARTTSAEKVVSVDLQAIEQSVSDRGPLDASLRWLPTGLRLPTGYDQVYRLGDGDLMRANGGLVATFDQSVYQSTRAGIAPMIPASTLFVIGGVPLGSERGHGRLLAVDPLDPAAIPAVAPPTSTPDDAYRSTATPGDRLRRFGYGAGHRVPVRADGGLESMPSGRGSRFTNDPGYRARRLAERLVSWRQAREAIGRRVEAIPPTSPRPD